MSIWTVCEAHGDDFRTSTYELLSRARELDAGETVAVVVGPDARNADRLAAWADRVIIVSGAALDPFAAEPWAEALAQVLDGKNLAAVAFGEGTRSRALMPRLAVRLGVPAVGNALGLDFEDGELRVNRPVFGGKAYETLGCGGHTCLLAFRPNSFAVTEPDAGAGTSETVEVSVAPSRVERVSQKAGTCGRVELTEAQWVVTGGRGLKSPDNLTLLEDLADALGGAVGVSRAVVDAGWADHSIQVGKSGKTVSPSLYVVAGVSGAVHHTMGMDTSKVVVAINTDPKAPIFQVADYGIVGDALQVLPALTEEIRKSER